MYTFGQMGNVETLFDEVEVIEAAITCELKAQDVDAARIIAEIQPVIDASENEMVYHYTIIAAKHAEREKRISAVREEGRGRLEELRRKLADAKHELVVINSPILILPYEVTAEIFNWHMLMGENMAAVLLVCKRWATVAHSSPRLWSRIAVTDLLPRLPLPQGAARRTHSSLLGLSPLDLHLLDLSPLRLQGAVRCTNLNQLRSVLSHVQSSPLQIELSFSGSAIFGGGSESLWPSSFYHGPQASANRVEAIKLILDNQVLRRCTFLVLGNCHLPFDHQSSPVAVESMTVLPLLSSIHIYATGLGHHERRFIQSLIKLSPLLRHIRCTGNGVGPQDLGEGRWARRVESYGWIHPFTSSRLLHGSPSLREVGIHGDSDVPLTLPALWVLRWMTPIYSGLSRMTTPHLHTLILSHPPSFSSAAGSVMPLSAGAVTLPNLRVAIHVNMPDLTILHGFQTPALEHLSIQSIYSSPTALFELFDGSAHMPIPKSLHLDCAFTDAALIAVLGRLPWLEELQVAGTIAQDAFWEGLTPSSNPTWRMWLPKSYPDELATRILTPNLKVLVVNYGTGHLYTPPKPQAMKRRRMTHKQRLEMVQLSDGSRGGQWTVMRASAVAIAREQSGCPFGTLACRSPERRLEVLVGNLDVLPQRPKYVSLTSLWCYVYVLIYYQ
jgi:F-box-like